GVYAEDPLANVHPELIDRYHGTFGSIQQRCTGQTDAEHPDDEDGFDDDMLDEQDEAIVDEDAITEELENHVADSQESNIRHAPIKVVQRTNPFNSQDAENLFYEIFAEVQQANIIPQDYGVLLYEWSDHSHPQTEQLKVGKRGKYIDIAVPEDIWFPRAILWIQALDTLSRIIDIPSE
ncbi:uncharacterized protein LAESUDRAFT_656210, partial [Laetiporus sulphureus 93-53]